MWLKRLSSHSGAKFVCERGEWHYYFSVAPSLEHRKRFPGHGPLDYVVHNRRREGERRSLACKHMIYDSEKRSLALESQGEDNSTFLDCPGMFPT